MNVELSALPPSLQTRVVQQRHFLQALTLALTGHDQRSMSDLAEELRSVAANVMPAIADCKRRAGDGDWHEDARIAAIQALAAAAGASLLDRAAAALRQGEHQRLEFVAHTRRALERAQQQPSAAQPPTDPPSTPGATTDPPHASAHTLAPSPGTLAG